MHPPVLVQCSDLRERITTRLTYIRTLPIMFLQHVQMQAVGVEERLAACLADMRLLP